MIQEPNAFGLDQLRDDAPHLLVVDDDMRIRTLLSRFLGSHGFRVIGRRLRRRGAPPARRASPSTCSSST